MSKSKFLRTIEKDGTVKINNVNVIDFQGGVTVTQGGEGRAVIVITGGSAGNKSGRIHCGYSGNGDNHYMEWFKSINGNKVPYLIPVNSKIITIASIYEKVTSVDLKIYINNTLETTLSFDDDYKKIFDTVNLDIDKNDEMKIFLVKRAGADNSPTLPIIYLDLEER